MSIEIPRILLRVIEENAKLLKPKTTADQIADLLRVALPAIYISAHYGNVRCKDAVREIEKILKAYES